MLKSLSLKVKLSLIAVLVFIGFLGYGFINYDAMNQVMIGGSLFNNISTSNELIADILPPPEYIIESYLVAYQLAYEDTNKETLINRLKQLETDYNTRKEYWKTKLSDGIIKDTLLTKSYTPAASFYNTINTKYLTAVQAGNQTEVVKILNEELRPLYIEHRKYIDELVTLANKQNVDIASSSKKIVNSRLWLSIFAGAFTLTIVTLIIIFLTIGVVKALKEIIAIFKDISEGKEIYQSV